MKIFVKVKPSAKEEKVVKVDDNHYKVSVKEPPINGKANSALQEILATYFGVPKQNIKIVSGYTSREKVIEIP